MRNFAAERLWTRIQWHFVVADVLPRLVYCAGLQHELLSLANSGRAFHVLFPHGCCSKCGRFGPRSYY